MAFFQHGWLNALEEGISFGFHDAGEGLEVVEEGECRIAIGRGADVRIAVSNKD